jgi:E3 ubiquitin-protein ligase HECTD3
VRTDLRQLRMPRSPPAVYIDRLKASTAEDDPSGRSSIFGQIFHELGPLAREMATFMPGSGEGRGTRTQWWVANFHNEAIQDAAGGFRDTVSSIGQDLMSERTPLFRPAGAAGFFVPNPLCANFEMYKFVGRLMAGCILSEERLVVSLPSYIWKKLARVPVTLADYYDIDGGVGDFVGEWTNKLQYLRQMVTDHPAECADGFSEILGFDVFFELEYVGHPGIQFELCPGGSAKRVTAANLGEWEALVQRARLHECDAQVRAGHRRRQPCHQLLMRRCCRSAPPASVCAHG